MVGLARIHGIRDEGCAEGSTDGGDSNKKSLRLRIPSKVVAYTMIWVPAVSRHDMELRAETK